MLWLIFHNSLEGVFINQKQSRLSRWFRGGEALISDLILTDEHTTVGVDDSIVEGTKRLIDMPGGVLIVLDESENVKGVMGTHQILKAVAQGMDSEFRHMWRSHGIGCTTSKTIREDSRCTSNYQ